MLCSRPQFLLLFLRLNRPGHNQSCDSRCCGIRTGYRILHIRCGRHKDLPGNRCKQAGCFVVIILYTLRPAHAVKGDGQCGQNRIKGVGNRGIVRSNHCLIPGILDNKRIGDPVVIYHLSGCDGFGNRQHRLSIRIHRFSCRNRCTQTVTGYCNSIIDSPTNRRIGISVCPCLIHDDTSPSAGTVISLNTRGGPAVTVGVAWGTPSENNATDPSS